MRAERREMDSPLSFVPSEADYHKADQDQTIEIDDGDGDDEGITPRTSWYLSEFCSQVEKEVERAVSGLKSSLGPVWEPPTSKRRR